MSSESDLEEESKQLGDLNRRLFLLMADIEDMGKCLDIIKAEAVEVKKQIDAKIKETKSEHQN